MDKTICIYLTNVLSATFNIITNDTFKVLFPGGRVLGLIFAGYVPLASQNPYLIIVYFVTNYRPHLGHFWANMYFFEIPT